MAALVWERFGDVPNYIEPFFGSGAVLLGRPHAPKMETINDLDCFVANAWRAIQCDPAAVAYWSDSPVNEADLHARHLWLVNRTDFRERMKTDPDYFDTKIAGWWVWGQCAWIGSGWCASPREAGQNKRPNLSNAGRGINRQLPHLGNAGRGINRQLPHLGNAGRGINRQLPHLGDAGRGINRKLPHLGDAGAGSMENSPICEYVRSLADRLRAVRVCCGDWSRICGPSVTFKHGITAVFLDPPYSAEAGRNNALYAEESATVARDVREWAISNGDNPLLRIALCGYEGEHAMPDDWDCVEWKARGGYGSQRLDGENDNAGRERIWFNKSCHPAVQKSLFEATAC